MDLASIKSFKRVIATEKCLYHPLCTKIKKTLRFTCEIHLSWQHCMCPAVEILLGEVRTSSRKG